MTTERQIAEAFSPGEYLRDELEVRGWNQAEFAEILGRPQRLVSEILASKRGITPETAKEIAAALGTSAQFWMNLDAAYQLFRTAPAPARITVEAKLREKFPVREMAKRGWIEYSENAQVLEARVLSFFDLKTADEEPEFLCAARKTGSYSDSFSMTQIAWLTRVRQLAAALPVKRYSANKLLSAMTELQKLTLSAEEIRNVPNILSECGVRFVIVEPLPQTKIDGACLWLNNSSDAPVVGMSLRFDRIDNFWFVLRHELEHVLRKDGIDSPIIDDLDPNREDLPEAEVAANNAAADFCVERSEFDDFIARIHPLYSEEKVLGFARRIKVHPGLVVGQIQNYTKRYDLFKKYLVKIRHLIVSAAITDGYGQHPSVAS